MGVLRSPRLLGPPVLLMGAAVLIGSVVPAALAGTPLLPPSHVQECSSAGLVQDGRLPGVVESSLADRLSSEVLLNASGEETGRRLTVGRGTTDTRVVTLPPESFVAGPYGGIVLYGWHSPGLGSEVRALAMSTGCDQRLARPAGIVRSAVLDPAASAVYVHTVSERERSDGGVTWHDLATGRSEQVVEPLPESDVYGRTYATSLVWRADGAELAVQSCGFSACRTRILDVTSGAVQTLEARPHGQLIGFDERALYAYDACHWAPCPLLALLRDGTDERVLHEEAYDAALHSDGGVARLLVETIAGEVEVTP